MASVVYVLCTITSAFCAVLLFRSYRKQRTRLLMWSTLCFVGLALNNILLVIDLLIVPGIDLVLVRSGFAMVAILLLVIGLVWEDA
jgi:hypothetical protein